MQHNKRRGSCTVTCSTTTSFSIPIAAGSQSIQRESSGELEYELGASLRNPWKMPDLLTSPKTVERRINQFAKALNLDGGRITGWAFSQAVLSAIWNFEDGYDIPPDTMPIRLAHVLAPMIDR